MKYAALKAAFTLYISFAEISKTASDILVISISEKFSAIFSAEALSNYSAVCPYFIAIASRNTFAR